MSQLTDILKEKEPLYIRMRLEASAIMLEELLKVLSTEQREKLNDSILSRFPSVKDASASNPYTVDYQLSLFIKK
ncbi:hypothetical protein [Serratia marcescens]|uniref:hypothetical protein n=1 Tax=Serratia marcescens TaxID=615 RepID=UPI003AAEBA66